jgi:glycosyltransferase involved in cell wall biosynthesis
MFQANPIRFSALVPYLFELGVQVRTLPWPAGTSFAERLPAVLEAIKWADVVQWRVGGWRWMCVDCPASFLFKSETDTLQEHSKRGHRVIPSNVDLCDFWTNARAVKRLAWVIDADDQIEANLLPAWWTAQHRIDLGHPVREADLLTVSTPMLEREAKRYNKNVRLIRNSINPSAYAAGSARPDGPTRLVWYADATRPDFDVSYCRQGVEDHRALLRTVRVGADLATPGCVAQMKAAGWDEVRGRAKWAVWPFALADAHPDIGVAPLADTPFERFKSELHWLDYSACGAPTVAERFRGGGPYDVIRDGVDGFLAHSRREWSDKIGRLARSSQLRDDIGGAAKERVIRDYGDPRQRAEELRDAYLWAAEHAGINRR